MTTTTHGAATGSSMVAEANVAPGTDPSWRPILGWVFAVSLMTVYLALFLRVCWRIGDEGSIVYGAQRVVEGAIPSRDFFEVMGPGAFYWLALWFKVLGTSWLTSRLAILATALCSAWAIHYATTRLVRGAIAVVPAIGYAICTVPLWPGANHHFDSNMWMLLAFAVVVGAPRFDARAGLATGVLAGIGSTIMPAKGLLMVIAVGAALTVERAVNRRKSPVLPGVVGMVGGFAAVGAAVVGFFWLNGSLYDLVYANAIWPATQYHSVNTLPYAYGMKQWLLPLFAHLVAPLLPGPLVYPGIAAALFPFSFLAALPFLVLASVGIQLLQAWKARVTPDSLPWVYWCCGSALFVAEWHRPDIMHVIFGSPILLIAGVSWLAQVKNAWGRPLLRVFVACTLLVAMLLGLLATAARTSVQTRRGTVAMFDNDDALEFIQDKVPAGRSVFIYPYYPMYYFLADVRNPTRYSIVLYHMNTGEQFAEIIRALESTKVEFVLWDTLVAGDNLTKWFPGYRQPPADQQVIERYLESKYELLSVKNGFRVLQRIDKGPSTAGIAALPRDTARLTTQR